MYKRMSRYTKYQIEYPIMLNIKYAWRCMDAISNVRDNYYCIIPFTNVRVQYKKIKAS